MRVRPARRVLVVDDHPGFRRCARTLLAAEGFDVVGEAETGAAAVSLAGEVEPELVLLDIQLPDFDGFEVAARLIARDPEAEDRARLQPRPHRVRLSDRGERRDAGSSRKADLSARADRGAARVSEASTALLAPGAPTARARRTEAASRLRSSSESGPSRSARRPWPCYVIAVSRHRAEPGRPRRADGRSSVSRSSAPALLALRRPPYVRFGLLLVAVGFASLLGALHEANGAGAVHDRRPQREPRLRGDRARAARVPEGTARVAVEPRSS